MHIEMNLEPPNIFLCSGNVFVFVSCIIILPLLTGTVVVMSAHCLQAKRVIMELRYWNYGQPLYCLIRGSPVWLSSEFSQNTSISPPPLMRLAHRDRIDLI